MAKVRIEAVSRRVVLTVGALTLAPCWVIAAPTPQTSIELFGVKVKVWGEYVIQPMLFPGEQWRFYVIVVPKEVRQGTAIRIAKDFYSKYPNTRARFFSDTTHVKQYIDRDRYMNDKTGKVKEVDFPDVQWVQDHLLGNINNRSKDNGRQWMFEDRYGNRIASLP